MVNSLLKKTLERQLDTVTTRLENNLKGLLHETRTSIEALEKGDALNTLMMKNRVDIDSLSSDYNRIREILEILSAEGK